MNVLLKAMMVLLLAVLGMIALPPGSAVPASPTQSALATELAPVIAGLNDAVEELQAIKLLLDPHRLLP